MNRRDFLTVIASVPGAKLLWPKVEEPALTHDAIKRAIDSLPATGQLGVTGVGESAATPIGISPTECQLVAIRNAGETEVVFSLDDTVVMRLLPGEQWVVRMEVAQAIRAMALREPARLEYLTGDAVAFRHFECASLLRHSKIPLL